MIKTRETQDSHLVRDAILIPDGMKKNAGGANNTFMSKICTGNTGFIASSLTVITKD